MFPLYRLCNWRDSPPGTTVRSGPATPGLSKTSGGTGGRCSATLQMRDPTRGGESVRVGGLGRRSRRRRFNRTLKHCVTECAGHWHCDFPSGNKFLTAVGRPRVHAKPGSCCFSGPRTLALSLPRNALGSRQNILLSV